MAPRPVDDPRAIRARLAQSFPYLQGMVQSRLVLHGIFGLIERYVVRDIPERASEAQPLREQLRRLAEELWTADVQSVVSDFEIANRRLAALEAEIDEASEAISPAKLRAFFERYGSIDDESLILFARHYLQMADKEEDDFDRIEIVATALLSHRAQQRRLALKTEGEAREILRRLLPDVPDDPPPDPDVDQAVTYLENVIVRIQRGEIGSLDRLHELQIVEQVRDFKRGLGELCTDPRILRRIVEYNVTVKNLIERLYGEEMQGLAGEIRRMKEAVTDLESYSQTRPADVSQVLGIAKEVEGAIDRSEEQEGTGTLVYPRRVREALDEVLRARERMVLDEAMGGPADAAAGPGPFPLEEMTAAGESQVPLDAPPSPEGIEEWDPFAEPLPESAAPAPGATRDLTDQIGRALASIAAGSDTPLSPELRRVRALAEEMETWELDAVRGSAGASREEQLVQEMTREILHRCLDIDDFMAAGSHPTLADSATRARDAGILLERVRRTGNRVQALVNGLVREGKLELSRRLSSTRARLVLRKAQMRAIAEASARPAPEHDLDAATLAGLKESLKPPPLESKRKPDGKKKKKKAHKKALPGMVEAGARMRRFILISSFFVIYAVATYLIVSNVVSDYYRDKHPDYRSFAVDQLRTVLPLRRAMSRADHLVGFVEEQWVGTPPARREVDVLKILEVLKPAGVRRVSIYLDRDPDMLLAIYEKGRVTILR